MKPNALPLLFLISLFSCTQAAKQQETTKDLPLTVFYFVRHAEQVKDGSKDPGLNVSGWQRAKQLEYFFKEEELSALYTTPFTRCQQTLIPTSKSQGIMFKTYESDVKAESFTQDLINKHKGEKVLIVGHKTTIPDMLNALVESDQYENLEDHQHSDIFQVVVAGEEVSVQHLKYDAIRNVEND